MIFMRLIYLMLAIYGAVTLVLKIKEIMLIKKNFNNIEMVINLKNNENEIENILRILKEKIENDSFNLFSKIIFVDLNSEDNTKEIVKRFVKENNYMELIEWRDYKIKEEKRMHKTTKNIDT